MRALHTAESIARRVKAGDAVGRGGGSAVATEFAGGGALELMDSVDFGGTVAGFAAPDQLDLRDILFSTGPTVSFTPGAGSGTLMVSGGGRVASITLIGSYSSGQFHLSSDGVGGTLVTDPPVAGGGAAASFTFADAAPPAASEDSPRPPPAAMPPPGYGSLLPLATDLAGDAFALLHDGLPPPG